MTITPPAAPWFFTASETDGVGNRIFGEPYRDARLGNRLRRHARGLLGEKASVISDENAMGGIFMPQHVSGNPARHAAHIIEGKIVGDEAAPAVSAKFDVVESLVVGRQSSFGSVGRSAHWS